jgi:hypothetical protein
MNFVVEILNVYYKKIFSASIDKTFFYFHIKTLYILQMQSQNIK